MSKRMRDTTQQTKWHKSFENESFLFSRSKAGGNHIEREKKKTRRNGPKANDNGSDPLGRSWGIRRRGANVWYEFNIHTLTPLSTVPTCISDENALISESNVATTKNPFLPYSIDSVTSAIERREREREKEGEIERLWQNDFDQLFTLRSKLRSVANLSRFVALE